MKSYCANTCTCLNDAQGEILAEGGVGGVTVSAAGITGIWEQVGSFGGVIEGTGGMSNVDVIVNGRGRSSLSGIAGLDAR